MSVQYSNQVFADAVTASPRRPNRVERVFGLHPALYAGTLAGYFGFLGIMVATFGDKNMAIPFVIFAVFLAAGFGVPALFARIAPSVGPKANWNDFMREGFDCATGHLAAPAVIAQVLILPFLLVMWGMAIAVIRALV